MQVAGLAVVEGVDAARRRGIVARRLVRERGKGKAVGVKEGGRKSPRLMAATRGWVLIFDVFLVGDVANDMRNIQSIGKGMAERGRKRVRALAVMVMGECGLEFFEAGWFPGVGSVTKHDVRRQEARGKGANTG